VLEGPYAILLGIVIAELIVFFAIASRKDLMQRLQDRGVTLSPFIFLFDVGRVPRMRKLTENPLTRKIMLVAGIINLVFLVALFYWQVLPSLVNIIKSMIWGVGEPSSPFVPVIPGLTINISSFIYILLALSIAIAMHELFHAIAAYAVGWKVEAWGVGLFLIFPVAYVKPSEEDFSKSSLKSKATVLSAGVLANTLLFLIVLPLLSMASAQVVTVPTIIGLTGEDTPAGIAGIEPPSVILSINGTRITSVADLQEFLWPLMNRTVTLEFNLSKGVWVGELINYSVTDSEIYVVKKNAGELIGIYIADTPTVNTSMSTIYSVRFLYWMQVVNFSLGIINAAPLYISDGGRLLSEALKGKVHPAINHVIQGGTVLAIGILLVVGLMSFV